MRYCFFLLHLVCSLSCIAQDPLPPVGQWREHLPYNSAIDVTSGDGKIFCATPYSLFSVSNADNVIERYSRVTGLHETGISTIKYDEVNHKLFIAYSNSNIDIIYRNDIFNVPDLKRDNIAGDKSVNRIYAFGKNYYLSTGLGVVVIDGDRYEVQDTWFIGSGGNQVKVSGLTADASFFYAATNEGLKKAPVNAANLADYSAWQLVSGTGGLPSGPCQHVFIVQNKVVVQKNDTLFVQNGIAWSLLYADGWSLSNSNVSENKILLCEKQANGSSRIVILNADGTVFRTVTGSPAVKFSKNAILLNNNSWVADSLTGLLRVDAGNTFQQYKLNSPGSVADGDMLVYNEIFYASAGSVTNAWTPQQNSNGFFIFKEGNWDNISRDRFVSIDSLKDFVSIAVDKRDETIWAGSFGGGLLHVKDGPVFEIFKQNTLGGALVNPASYRATGLAFDNENNLWVANYGAAQPLRVRKSDGSWKNFNTPFSLIENAVAQIAIADNNFKWIVSPLANGLLCFDHGASIDNTGDDRWRKYNMGSGSGNLPSDEVLCIAKDKSGFIWVGTADGVGVIQCPDQAFNSPVCDAVWPVIPNGNFAGYLFKGQRVQSIAVDGADRKWVGTKNGAFLVSAEGEKVIYRFTEENSPLLSNDVRRIAIDGKTGEVYFATAKGICSFRSTATEGGEKNEDVLVFPNPVPPGYTGTIAIRGLVNNAIVKITELDGRLVYQTRALGGQAIWDGRNYRGQKISSGAYLVLVNEETGNSLSGKKEHTATKIFFISK